MVGTMFGTMFGTFRLGWMEGERRKSSGGQIVRVIVEEATGTEARGKRQEARGKRRWRGGSSGQGGWGGGGKGRHRSGEGCTRTCLFHVCSILQVPVA